MHCQRARTASLLSAHLRPLAVALLTGLFSVSATAALINGGFEAGATGWNFSGEGSFQVLPSLGPLTPTEGVSFALLGNGPGDRGGASDTAVLLSDPFSVASAAHLRFDLVFVTAEFTGSFAELDRLDGFFVNLLPLAGPPDLMLLSDDVSNAGFALFPGQVTAPDGSAFFEYHTYLYNQPIAPGFYRLRFTVFDQGDNAFDSGLLIDGVTVVGEVPEPGTALLLASGVALFLIRKRLMK